MITPHIPKLLQACQNLSSYSAISSKLKKKHLSKYILTCLFYILKSTFLSIHMNVKTS